MRPGPTPRRADHATVPPEPFRVHSAEHDLADLADRSARIRWPAGPAGWGCGADPEYLRALLSHWTQRYAWGVRERGINRLPRFRTDVAGTAVHFAHVRGRGPVPLPLVLTHPPRAWAERAYSDLRR